MMKILKKNGIKHNLAMLLICLLVLGVCPYENIVISHAEAEEAEAEETEAEAEVTETEGTEAEEAEAEETEAETYDANDGVSDENNSESDDEDNATGILMQEIYTDNSSNALKISNISSSNVEKKMYCKKVKVKNKNRYIYYCSVPAKITVNLKDKSGNRISDANILIRTIDSIDSIDLIDSVESEESEESEELEEPEENISESFSDASEEAIYQFPQTETDEMNCKGVVEITRGDKKTKRDQYIIYIDNISPKLEIKDNAKGDSQNIYVNGDNIYYTSDAEVILAASDDESGLSEVMYSKDFGSYKDYEDELEFLKEKYDEPEFKFKAVDNAGNELEIKKFFYKDDTAPTIEYFQISESADKESVAYEYNAQVKEYEYFFNKETEIKVYASDGNGCGVNDINVYTVSGLGKNIEDIDNKKEQLETSDVIYDSENKKYYVTATVKDGFKGRIYAEANDYLENKSLKTICLKGLIVESQAIHEQDEHIKVQFPSTPYKDEKGQDLYGGNVNVQVTVTDEISGVQLVEQTIKTFYDGKNEEKAEQWEIFNKENNAVNEKSGWESKVKDANLAVKVQKKLLVTGNGNDITYEVMMTDCAGNTSTDSKTFSIDKTKPVISVNFDNNEYAPDYPQVYNRPRTATITVKERNFISSGMSVDITSSSGAIPQVSEWVTNVDKKNPDNTVSTATVTFSEDGDYTMSISGYDKVRNKADTVTVENFTIDRTAPVIRVSFDKNNAQNRNIYGETRTAGISITEHNFAPERVKITGTISNADAGTAFPVTGGWSHNGDVHTATILCETDGDYQFDVECTDKAGNVGDKYNSETYTIDKTAPVIEITGVENFSANNGDVIPIVSITDRNYDENSVSIQLTGRNHGVVEYDGTFTWQEKGQRFIYENFPKELKYDDLYTVNVKTADLAGNAAAEDITFSVNRFGSVYVFDQALTEMDGRYISKEQSVKLREINVDSLERSTIDIVVDANGNPKRLTEGDDYTVRQSDSDSGWYCYDYDIQESVFAGDGRYIVTVYSEDRAGNRNQNTEESKKAEIRFGIDKTSPIVTSIDVESNRQYPVEVKQATVAVIDNLVLNNVVIYVDGKESAYTVDGENYTFEIQNADRNQTISIVATDMAGNINNYVIDNVLVSTNLLARWYYNTRLFVASIICMLLLLGCGIGTLILSPKRRSRVVRAGLLLIPILAVMSVSLTAHAEETDPVQQKETSVLQMVVFYTDNDGNDHPVQGGTGFLIGTESDMAEYMITAKEVTSVSGETEQQLMELYGDPEKTTQFSYNVKAVVKRDVMIDVQLVAESDEMGFAIWKLGQPLYDRQALILCDEALSRVSGQKATVLGFPTAPSLTGETVYYTMDEMVSKEGALIGDGSEDNIKYLYHNITLNSGMIGGPILNESGNVIAINQSRKAQEGYYALQMSELLPVLEALGIPYVTTSAVEEQRQAELAAIVHKEELQKGILNAESLDSRLYYKKTYTVLQDSLEAAMKINDSDTATQEDVDTALANIQEAMDGLKEKPPIWVTLLIVVAVIAIVAVLSVIWWKKSKPKREQKKQKKLEELTVTQAAPQFEEKPIPKEDYRELVKQDSQDIYQTGLRREEEIYGETTVFQDDMETNAQYVYLIRMRTGEKIAITGREFVLGKDPSQTDYCIKGNSAISRVHVVIINTGMGYDVSDKNATNGTFVNNVKVAAFQKSSLKPGDILRLADEDFEFRVSGDR